MPDFQVRQLIRIKLHGGVRHRIGIAIAAEVAARKGYKVDDMSGWRGMDEEPDLVISKKEKIGTAWVILRYRLEVIDSHDPVPVWDRSGGYNDLIKIQVKDMDAQQILLACEGAIL